MAGRGRRDGTTAPAGEFRLRRADEAILAALADAGAEYPAIVASRAGLHVPYVRERFEALAAAGLVEQVTDEVVYRITEDGLDRRP